MQKKKLISTNVADLKVGLKKKFDYGLRSNSEYWTLENLHSESVVLAGWSTVIGESKSNNVDLLVD